jgi:hypothetical protein
MSERDGDYEVGYGKPPAGRYCGCPPARKTRVDRYSRAGLAQRPAYKLDGGRGKLEDQDGNFVRTWKNFAEWALMPQKTKFLVKHRSTRC